jgi:hypothetical protein
VILSLAYNFRIFGRAKRRSVAAKIKRFQKIGFSLTVFAYQKNIMRGGICFLIGQIAKTRRIQGFNGHVC